MKFEVRLIRFVIIASFCSISPSDAANCSTVTCHNGGTCNNYTDSPPCLCPLPYIAPYCSAAADYCFTLQPDKNITELPVCLNGGNCTLTYTDPYFNCTCPSGTTGLRCNEKVSEPTDEIEYRLSAAATAGIAVGVVVGVGASVSLAVFAVHRASGRSRFSLCCCSKKICPTSQQQSHAAYNNEGGNFDDNSACKTNGGLGSGSAHHQDQQISA